MHSPTVEERQGEQIARMIHNRLAGCGFELPPLELDALVSSIQLYPRESAQALPVRNYPALATRHG